MVGHLRGVADELGFRVYLAQLDYTISGSPKQGCRDGCNYDREAFESGNSLSGPEMDDDRPLNHTMELRKLVNFEGVAVVPSTKGVNLDSSSLFTWTMKASMVVVGM